MLGIVYIALCILSGRIISDLLFPEYRKLGEKSFQGRELHLPVFFVYFPFWYFTGTLAVSWCTYLAALVLKNWQERPLGAANVLMMTAFAVTDALFLYLEYRKKKKAAASESGEKDEKKAATSESGEKDGAAELSGEENGSEKQSLERIFSLFLYILPLLFFLVFLIRMEYRSFSIHQGRIRVGYSVFSDFATHLGMIRSFSYGNNFPTWYSHYAGEDIRYHFMFQFLAGNLEFLGLPLDHAFNFPSILSMLGACMLLFVLGTKLFGKRLCGLLSVCFMIFHSSPSLLRYLAELPKGSVSLGELLDRDSFFSYTPKEDWGLWNFKVYLNQRHLAFGIGVALMAILIMMPLLFQLFERMQKEIFSARKQKQKAFPAVFRAFLLEKEAILPENLRRALFAGLLLGFTAFWNGAMVIAALCVLFVMALCSSHRLEYLLTAVLAVGLSSLQSMIFIRGSAVSPKYQYGFIAENPSFWGCCAYLLALSGILLILTAAFAIMERGALRYLVLAFSGPLILAFTLSLTPDITVNHKYVMFAFILLGIVAAGIVTNLLESVRYSRIAGGILLIILLTITGVYECRVTYNIDRGALVFDEDDPLTVWIRENSDSRDIFLTDMYSLHEAVLGGAMLYYGWPYYAWSAGYDTAGREKIAREIFAAEDTQQLKALVSGENIRYILIDDGLRHSNDYLLREDVIAAAFPLVYENGAYSIYDAGRVIP